MQLVLKFKRLTSNAFTPLKASKRDAGFDLFSAYYYVVPSQGKELIKTDIAGELPKGTYGRIPSRSGLAWKSFITVAGGVIDEGYRGNICVILYNFSKEDFYISKGDRIAQLICEKIANITLIETYDLSQTDREDKGFGSSGINILI